jgi:hypothetical protein
MVVVRMDPDLYKAMLTYTGNVSRAVEEAVELWVARAKRSRRRTVSTHIDGRTVAGRNRED